MANADTPAETTDPDAISASDSRWMTIGIILAIFIGIGAILYFIPGAIIGIILCIVAKETPHKTDFQRLALTIATALNAFTLGVPILLVPISIFASNIAIPTATALSMLMLVLMGRYAFELAKNDGLPPLKPVAMAIGGTIGGIVIAKLLNVVLLDDRGFEDILLRMALVVIPISGWLVIAIFQRWKWQRQAQTHFRFATMIILAFVIVQSEADQWLTDPHRKALPIATLDVHEWEWHDFLITDYAYCLKAKMSRGEFIEYIALFDLSLHPATPKRSDDMPPPQWSGPDEPNDWWDVTETMDSTYYIWPRYDSWTLAKYERGYLYLHASQW
jgi:hypothetical protein